MATGWEPDRISENEIADGEAYHRALYINGDIERPANWHRESADRLVKLAIPHIKDGSLVVDYGSGTGGSAIELLKEVENRGMEINLVLIDPLVSWFSKARDLLKGRQNVHFELSIKKDDSSKLSFRRLENMLGGRKADVIISSSTMHLIPERAIRDLASQFAGSLKENGVFIWDSGDLESEFRPAHSALLHDPYRAVREILRNDENRAKRLSEMSSEEVLQHEGRLDRIFPGPYSIDVILDALSAVGFSSETHDEVVGFSNDDAERFALVPRLSEVAAPLLLGEERDEAIRGALKVALAEIAEQGKGSKSEYRSHWVYGVHRLG